MPLIALALLACGGPDLPEQQATWLTGLHYGWVGFNHRLSYVEVGTTDDQVLVSVVGGTSTTSERPDPLPTECDPDACEEFPVPDNAEVRVGWGKVVSDQVAMGTGRGTLEVGSDGAKTTITVAVPEGAKGDPTALLRGLTFDTDHDLAGGPNCYQAKYGWHPRRIRAEILSATLDGDTVTVEVGATFEAGATLEDVRVCVDDVYDQAVVNVAVEVLAIVTEGAVEDQPLSFDQTYPFSGDKFDPGEQVEVAPEALSWSLDQPIVGWSSIDFRFNEDHPEQLGAYIRTLGFEITDAGASGVATNYSPGTQLTDMTYSFEGTARAVEVEGTVTGGTVAQTIPVQLDDVSGAPIVYELDF